MQLSRLCGVTALRRKTVGLWSTDPGCGQAAPFSQATAIGRPVPSKPSPPSVARASPRDERLHGIIAVSSLAHPAADSAHLILQRNVLILSLRTCLSLIPGDYNPRSFSHPTHSFLIPGAYSLRSFSHPTHCVRPLIPGVYSLCSSLARPDLAFFSPRPSTTSNALITTTPPPRGSTPSLRAMPIALSFKMTE